MFRSQDTDQRWLVTGAGGQLGSRLMTVLAESSADAVGLTHRDLDITDTSAVGEALASLRPDVLINAAAYTAVDAAEHDEQTAELINSRAPGLLAAKLADLGGRMIHVSTDYVFAGDATQPYDVEDPVAPRTAYGRTKLAGERAVRAAGGSVVRTAWVFGGPGANFVDTMRALERTRDTVSVVDDQVGSPTYAGDLASALVELAAARLPPQILHFANAGQATWFELARAVFEEIGADPERIRPTTSAEFVRPAPRPAWSVLSTRSWVAQGLTPPRSWRVALRESLT